MADKPEENNAYKMRRKRFQLHQVYQAHSIDHMYINGDNS